MELRNSSYCQDDLRVEFPTGSGDKMNLHDIAQAISKRLVSTFQKDETGYRPVNDYFSIYRDAPNFKDLILFYEYFHGDTARGVGASHQTGWTGVIAGLINRVSKVEEKEKKLTEEVTV